MKRRKRSRTIKPSAAGGFHREELEKPVAPPPPPARSSRKREWLFRIAALLLPLVLLGLLEAGLRWSGYGYPTHFFLESKSGGRGVLTDNEKFGWRFFPRPLARAPRPFSIAATKPPGTYRIFILGESAAMGDPEPAFGFGRMLQVLLQERYPQTRIEVINAAMTAINSNVILPIAQDCAAREGDLWVIYMGNNEMIGPFGARTVFGKEALPLPLIRARLAVLGMFRTGQWLDDLVNRFRNRRHPVESWSGMEMFLDKQVAASDPRVRTVYRHFAKNLADLLQAGSRAGVQQIVCTVGTNLRDCAPFASQHGPGYTSSSGPAWDRFYTNGIAAEKNGNLSDAIDQFTRASIIDPDFAELQFRLARSLSASGQLGFARRHWAKARDLDTLRFRSDTEINRIIRETCAARARDGIFLLDAADLFARQSPRGTPGDELFYDHVHLTLEGNYLLARAIAEMAAPLRAHGTAETGAKTNDWLLLEQCGRRLGWSGWDEHRIWQDLRQRFSGAPFSNQLGKEERDQRIDRQLTKLARFTRDEGLSQALEICRQAVERMPEDWPLRAKYAELLSSAGDLDAAIRQWKKATELLPHFAALYENLGNALFSAGRYSESEQSFVEALRRRPEFAEAWNGLGQCRAGERRFPEAITAYTRALQIKPGFAAAHVNLGVAFENEGRLDEAADQYRAGIQFDTNSAAAHANLGHVLIALTNLNGAARELAEALRLMPNSPATHFNLGNVLHNQGEELAAMEEYAAAVRLNPDFIEARVNWGLILMRQGRMKEALTQLSAAVRLKPDSAKARVNYGMALAKQQNFSAAIVQFREALRIEPDNAAAKKYLEIALSQSANAP